jgi:hypothetical protein
VRENDDVAQRQHREHLRDAAFVVRALHSQPAFRWRGAEAEFDRPMEGSGSAACESGLAPRLLTNE